MQKRIATYGARGRTVRVFAEGDLVRVQWRTGGVRKTESWPDTRENRVRARAFAEGVAQELDRRGRTLEALTLQGLWTRYLTAESPAWRPATLTNAREHWRLFTLVVGATLMADEVTPELMDEVAQRLRKLPAKGRERSPVSVGRTCDAVRRVFAWAARRQLLARDPLASWRPKRAKDERPLQVDAYTAAEVGQLLAQLDRRSSRQWRAWVMTALCGALGRRQRAVLHLEWRDVDFAARTVRWRAETDKLGRDATIPMNRLALHALRVARVWGGGGWASAPASRWVLPAVQDRRGDQPWTYQAANRQLHEAEARAGIPHQRYRAFHGARRQVVTTIHEATGNLELAGQIVGDLDPRTLRRSYLRIKPQALQDAVHIIDNAVATERGE